MSRREQRCETCRWWRQGTLCDLREPMQCRRYPPVSVHPVNGGRDAMWGEWPATLSDDWCGEWQERPAEA